MARKYELIHFANRLRNDLNESLKSGNILSDRAEFKASRHKATYVCTHVNATESMKGISARPRAQHLGSLLHLGKELTPQRFALLSLLCGASMAHVQSKGSEMNDKQLKERPSTMYDRT